MGEAKGKLVVIEGLDGTGKTTQGARVAEALAAAGRKVRLVKFPSYHSPSSALVKMYLAGEFGQDPMEVNAWAASAFYAVDRYASWKTDWGGFYAEGGLVVADRYTTSNAIHQCSKLPKDEWEGYIAWLTDFEYAKLGIPAPDAVVCLDVAPEISQELMRRRYQAGGEKDIHERDLAYLARSREAALWCAQRLGWQVVECAEGGAMRPMEKITDEIVRRLTQQIAKETQTL